MPSPSQFARVPEPELMCDPEQVAAYAGADLDVVHAHLTRWFEERLGAAVGHGIELGCGSGDVARRFLTDFPRLTLLGVDGSEPMIEAARAMARRLGLEARLRLEPRRLPDAQLPREHFAVVLSNSVLHHLDETATLWDTVRQCAAPGAAVFVCDLCRPRDGAAAETIVAREAGDAHPLLKRDFFQSLCAAYTPGEIRRQISEAGLGWLHVETVGELHWVAWGRRPAGASQ